MRHAHTRPVVLVTGAARRIGAAIVRTLHAQGMNIILHYHTSTKAATTLANTLNRARPHSVCAITADLADLKQGLSLIDQAVTVWGRLDGLVNNASLFYPTPFGHLTDEDWERLLHLNAKIPLFMAQRAAPFLKQSKGAIVNITDFYAEQPLSRYLLYSISKSALWMTTKALAQALGPAVRVNAIAPGPILWPENENTMTAVAKRKLVQQTTLKKLGHPDEIAKAVLYLLREAHYMTGQVLKIDGGR